MRENDYLPDAGKFIIKRIQGKKACESAFFSHFEITWEKTLLRGSTISKHINRTCSL